MGAGPLSARLRARRETTAMDPFGGIQLGAGLPDTNEIERLTAESEEMRRAFDAQVEHIEGEVAKASANFRERAHAGLIPKGEARRGFNASAIAAITGAADMKAEQEAAEYRHNILASTEKNRDEQLKRLDAAATRLRALTTVYPTPQA